ncbi:MAG: hypothetical protein IPO97_00465 [Sphingomonadales bacterium]|nr:hypothetical protein [Sphingomonadales bacterium]
MAQGRWPDTLTCLTNLPNITISMGPETTCHRWRSDHPADETKRRRATIPYLILKPDGTEWSQTGSIIPGTPLDVPGVDGHVRTDCRPNPQGTKFPLTGSYSDSVIVYLGF